MKKVNFRVTVFICLLVGICTFNGIYRHDQPVEKYLKLATDKRFDCVARLIVFDQGRWHYGGSAVLIDSLHLLTAAHCLVSTYKKDTIVNVGGSKVKTYISRGIKPMVAGQCRILCGTYIADADSVLIYPEYLKDKSCDLAIVKLKKPIRSNVYPALNSFKNEPGDTVIGVGYGASGPADKPELVNSYDVKLAGMNIIDSLAGKKSEGEYTLLIADFDRADTKKHNRCGDSRPLELEYSPGGGDSGGPLFVIKQNELILTGLVAFSENKVQDILDHGYYGAVSGWTRVSVFSTWIEKNRKSN